MKKSSIQFLSVFLALVLIFSLCAFPSFAADAEDHVHTEACEHGASQVNVIQCPHTNTYTILEGEDVYVSTDFHNSYEIVNTYCQDCGLVIRVSRELIGANPHNSLDGSHIVSFTHISNGTKHLNTLSCICTCGYTYDGTSVTACNCSNP